MKSVAVMTSYVYVFFSHLSMRLTAWEIWCIFPPYARAAVNLVNMPYSRSMSRNPQLGMIQLVVPNCVTTELMVVTGAEHHAIILLDVDSYSLFRPLKVTEAKFFLSAV